MSVSTLLAAFALGREGREGRARRWLLLNGMLLPFITLQMYWHPLIWPAALWAVTFPAAMLSLAALFRNAPAAEEAAGCHPAPSSPA